jgi:hypothetical protein
MYTQTLTPCSRALLENLAVLQSVKNYLAFYGTPRFITAFSNARTSNFSEQARSGPYPHIPLPDDPSQYYPLNYA